MTSIWHPWWGYKYPHVTWIHVYKQIILLTVEVTKELLIIMHSGKQLTQFCCITDGVVTEHYHFILFKIWGWNGQKLRFCVDGSLKRRTKRGLQKHPDTSGWGLNRPGKEIIAPSVPSFPYFSSNDFCRPLSPSDGRFPPCVCLHVCSCRGAYRAP